MFATNLAHKLGAAGGGILWWAIMVVNSLVCGAVLSLVVFPFLRKVLTLFKTKD